MRIPHCFGLAVLPLFFAFCPLASAVSYSWNFTGSGGTNCPIKFGSNSCANPGNSMSFTTSGVTATVTAWYLNSSGTLQKATLGQYSSGLGVCYAGENCSSSSRQQLDDSGNEEFLLLTFSKPVDPTSITIQSPTTSGLGVSYWLGSTTSQSLNLTNMNMTSSLSTMGFGSATSSDASKGSTRTIDFGGPPTTSVNAILFGAMYSSDSFEISGFSGGTPVAASVPEPASIFLLFTVAVAGFGLRRRAGTSRQ